MPPLDTIYPPSRAANIDRQAILNLEELLNTKFIDLDAFFELRDWQRVFGALLKNHSIIAIAEDSYDWSSASSQCAIEVYPPLHMSIKIENGDNGSFRYVMNFEADGQLHKVQYDTLYPSLTLLEVNENMKSQKFIELDMTSPDVEGKGIVWFLVPKDLEIKKLCDVLGYTGYQLS